MEISEIREIQKDCVKCAMGISRIHLSSTLKIEARDNGIVLTNGRDDRVFIPLQDVPKLKEAMTFFFYQILAKKEAGLEEGSK
jgi:hypothetical protein